MEYFESFKKTIIFILIIVFPIVILSMVLTDAIEEEVSMDELKEKYAEKHISSATIQNIVNCRKNLPHLMRLLLPVYRAIPKGALK